MAALTVLDAWTSRFQVFPKTVSLTTLSSNLGQYIGNAARKVSAPVKSHSPNLPRAANFYSTLDKVDLPFVMQTANYPLANGSPHAEYSKTALLVREVSLPTGEVCQSSPDSLTNTCFSIPLSRDTGGSACMTLRLASFTRLYGSNSYGIRRRFLRPFFPLYLHRQQA